MVEKSDYLIIKTEMERKEMIRTLEMNEIREQHRDRQRKELENEVMRTSMIKEIKHQELMNYLKELEKLILYGN
jgi:hypothetical protein